MFCKGELKKTFMRPLCYYVMLYFQFPFGGKLPKESMSYGKLLFVVNVCSQMEY